MTKINFAAKDEPYSISLPRGKYLFQCWGASGSLIHAGTPGKGGYTSGILNLNKPGTFYFYVGRKGAVDATPHFNYDITNEEYVRGGAAVDIRLKKGQNWYDFESLASRIMVAAGGGSTEKCYGGDAGGFEGKTNTTCDIGSIAGNANQTSGGIGKCIGKYGCGTNGKFGIAGEGYGVDREELDYGPGGGSGYYGGGGTVFAGSGGGGSSYVSGFYGCDSITSDSTEDNITHSGSAIHFSGVFFYDSVIKGGYEHMISPEGKEVIGNTGDGFARITVLSGNYGRCTCKGRVNNYIIYVLIIIITTASK